MSDDAINELLHLSAINEPGDPFRGHYPDPVEAIIWKLPFLPVATRESLIELWYENGPVERVLKAVDWYDRHDNTILLLARIFTAVTPLALTAIGVPLTWSLMGVIVLVFGVEWFDRARSTKNRERAVKQAKKEYYREVVQPQVSARRRAAFREIEVDDEETKGDDRESNE